MRELYPPIDINASYTVSRPGGHALYVEECGNPQGVPVVFLHGGPGAGCEAWHRQFFNPLQARIILFDQRGAGHSTPHAGLEHNTTQDLIGDMEYLREFLGVKQWIVFGGSWGSTLALAYAETYPQNCLGLILRGIFLCRPEDILWFYQQGANRLFPDAWQSYLSVIPADERHDMVSAYYKRLTSDDEQECLRAAIAWSTWEGKTLSLIANKENENYFSNASLALSLARIECHYFINNIFLPPNHLLAKAGQLQDIPGIIVHGRYDVVCPVDQAFALSHAWQSAELHIMSGSGHAANEREIADALICASDAMIKKFSKRA